MTLTETKHRIKTLEQMMWQYRSDLLHPPATDSIHRRIEAIDRVMAVDEEDTECEECEGTGHVDGVCATCNGSGVGMFGPPDAPGNYCSACGGGGVQSYECEECDGAGSVNVT